LSTFLRLIFCGPTSALCLLRCRRALPISPFFLLLPSFARQSADPNALFYFLLRFSFFFAPGFAMVVLLRFASLFPEPSFPLIRFLFLFLRQAQSLHGTCLLCSIAFCLKTPLSKYVPCPFLSVFSPPLFPPPPTHWAAFRHNGGFLQRTSFYLHSGLWTTAFSPPPVSLVEMSVISPLIPNVESLPAPGTESFFSRDSHVAEWIFSSFPQTFFSMPMPCLLISLFFLPSPPGRGPVLSFFLTAISLRVNPIGQDLAQTILSLPRR